MRRTVVKNPVHRQGYPAFKTCSYCGGEFTALGLPRHWDKCPKRPKAATVQPLEESK